MLQTSRNRTIHRKRLVESFNDQKSKNSVVYLSGTEASLRIPTSDVDQTFRQESNFYWVTGCNEANCATLINLDNGEFTLLVPELDDEHALWCGDFPVESDYKKVLGADKVVFNNKQNLEQLLNGVEKVYTLKHTATNIPKQDVVDTTKLYENLRELRMVKLSDEIEEMRKIVKIAADAHVEVMKHSKPNMNEYELEAVFIHNTQRKGARNLAYSVIAAGDDRGATLHYVQNNQVVHDGGLFLIDAGAESETLYASDITRTYPINGKFTQQQRDIYNLVLEANKQVIAQMKPGVSWVDMHRLAERVITEGLKNLNIIQADSLQELIDNHIGGYFLPHGLGHAIGLDVHDPPNRDGSFQAINEPGIRYLRVHCILKEGNAMTVEPGCYFNPRMLQNAMADEKISKYFNQEKIKEYLKFGGIRIEDNVVVTKDGVEVLSSDVPKEIDEMEKLIGSAYKN